MILDYFKIMINNHLNNFCPIVKIDPPAIVPNVNHIAFYHFYPF